MNTGFNPNSLIIVFRLKETSGLLEEQDVL